MTSTSVLKTFERLWDGQISSNVELGPSEKDRIEAFGLPSEAFAKCGVRAIPYTGAILPLV